MQPSTGGTSGTLWHSHATCQKVLILMRGTHQLSAVTIIMDERWWSQHMPGVALAPSGSIIFVTVILAYDVTSGSQLTVVELVR
jgi:hypothetical protein